jgi:poly-gamma-glutamate biosynthesis protein PgsC/CapC
MNPEVYIITGIVLGLLFTELTGLSPGGIIVPGYMALFLNRPLEIVITVAAAVGVMFGIKLVSNLFFLFGRRRYALCLLLGVLLKLIIDFFYLGLPVLPVLPDIRLIGWLIPGIIASDMYKQGIPRTLFAAATVTAMVFLLAQGWRAIGFN